MALKNMSSILFKKSNSRKPPRSVLIFNISIYFIIFFTLLYTLQTQIIFRAHGRISTVNHHDHHQNPISPPKPGDDDHNQKNITKTELHHIVFGIASSSKVWNNRKNYIKQWWKPEKMRGFAWLDNPVVEDNSNISTVNLPPVKISSDTSRFKYRNKNGDRSALRLTRIAAETVRMGLKDVRWIVLGDDDTFFVPDNLLRVLSKYDHNGFYYIGSSSETHVQNIDFSYNMAYGGGGFAISYPLAAALEKMQDKCIQRYPGLYGSDDRIQACTAELGVPLTKETGFHQFDIYGNAFGLLTAHPIAPFVSLHHLDLIEPIFPKMSRGEALKHLKKPIELDSAAVMQQSICYDKARDWTVSISWGYAIQIYRTVVPAREVEKPIRTFVNWYRKSDDYGLTLNTRAVDKTLCGRPTVYLLSNARRDDELANRTVSEYVRLRNPGERKCKRRRTRTRRMVDPTDIRKVEVFKKPEPDMWDKARRRNCCRVLPMEKKGTISIEVGECREGEIIGY